MGYKDNNIYYSPESFGLTAVVDVDTAGSYEFDIFVVFQKEDGALYYASDSGCSCPIPFEDIEFSDLKKIDKDTFEAFRLALKNHYNISKEEINDVETKVKNLLGI